MTKKILITGFDPFDQSEKNPSGDWINWMKARSMPADSNSTIKGVVLPVTFGGAFDSLKKIYDEFCPDIIVLTGLAKNRTLLTVERIGINWVDARIPDNSGYQPFCQKIDESGPDGHFTTVNVNSILELGLKAGYQLKLSTSAGEYVCNDLLYRTLHYTKNKNTAVTFIHLPFAEDYNGIYLALETIVSGL